MARGLPLPRCCAPCLAGLWGIAGSASPSGDAPPGIGMHLGLGKYKRPHPADLHRQLFLYNFLYNVWRQGLVWRREDGTHLLLPLDCLEAT